MRWVLTIGVSAAAGGWIAWGAYGTCLGRFGFSNGWVSLALAFLTLWLPALLVGRRWSGWRRAKGRPSLGRSGWLRLLVACAWLTALSPLAAGYPHLQQVLYRRPLQQLQGLLRSMRSARPNPQAPGPADRTKASQGAKPTPPEPPSLGSPARSERRAGNQPRSQPVPQPAALPAALAPSIALSTTALGGTGVEHATLAAGPAGLLVLGGRHSGTLSIGTTSLPAVERAGTNAFVALFGADGQPRWAKSYDHAAVTDLAFDGAGNLLVAGSYTRWSSRFDKGRRCSGGARHLFLLKLDPAGKELWAVSGLRSAQLAPTLLRVAPSGAIYLAGWFGPGALTLAGTRLEAPAGQRSAFFAKLDESGRFVWARALPASDATISAIAPTREGGLYLGGSFESGLLQLGSVPLVNLSLARDAFVAKVDAQGTFLWASRHGGPGDDRIGGLAARPDGGLSFALSAERGPLVLDRRELASAIRFDALVVTLDAAGHERWSMLVWGDNSETPGALAVGGSGETYLAAYSYSESLRIAGLGFAKRGNRDLLLARISADGTRFWAERFGGGQLTPTALVAHGGDQLTVLGSFKAELQLDTLRRLASGPADLFLTRRRLPAPQAVLPALATAQPPRVPPAVFRPSPLPRNPRLDPNTHPYLRELYFWLDKGLDPAALDPQRRLDTTGDIRAAEAPLRLFAADHLLRRKLPPLLRAAGQADLAGALAQSPPLTSAKAARTLYAKLKDAFAGLKSGKRRLIRGPRGARGAQAPAHGFALLTLVLNAERLLQLDGAEPERPPRPGVLSHPGSKHAASLGASLAIAWRIETEAQTSTLSATERANASEQGSVADTLRAIIARTRVP